MMARSHRRSLSSTGHYAAGCVTVTLLAALSLILLRGPAAEKRCDLSSYDAASTEALDLKRCKISTLPVAIADFRRLKKLDLGFNALQALPALPPSLEVLFLLANGFEEVASLGLGSGFLGQALRFALSLTYPSPSPSPGPNSHPSPNPNLTPGPNPDRHQVPPAISLLPRLRMLSFKSCALRSVHVPLPVSLQWLILTDNRLAELPHQIGELVLMRKLMLSNKRALHTLAHVHVH